MCWCACAGLRSAFWKVSSNCGITTFHRSFNEDLQKYAERDTNASPAHYPQPRGDTHTVTRKGLSVCKTQAD